MYKGCFAAITTPFKDNRIDESALFAHSCFLKANSLDGIVCCGTTGEAATLSNEEYKIVTSVVRKAVGKGYPVIMGAGSNSTLKAVELSLIALDAGADAVLSVTPYYNKPSQKGLIEHFKYVADRSPVPIILYNVPGRTGIDMSWQTIGLLSEHKNIIGLKEANPDQHKLVRMKKFLNDEFTILSGDDYTVVPSISTGVSGVISVIANILPEKFSKMVHLALSKDYENASVIQAELTELIESLFIESNPMPVKTALFYMGMLEKEFRLPLVTMAESNEKELFKIIGKYGLV